MTKNVRHVLGVSGGKDSAALAVYMAQNFPELDIEYFFTDTGKELPEVYQFLGLLEGVLGKEIQRLQPATRFSRDPKKVFDDLLKEYNNFLPSAQARWCTVEMKIRPFEKWIAPTLENGGKINTYIAIRADENRQGYKSTNPAVTAKFPLSDAGIDKPGVLSILEDAGIGLPKYYDWRSRSGCTFCFYQQKIEWVKLMEQHPEKFEEAKSYEKLGSEDEGRFTWNERESLESLSSSERIAEIKEDYEIRLDKLKKRRVKKNPLLVGADDLDKNISIDDIYGVQEGKSLCISCHK
jgi:3'-phosphoadenosine 5'-phosphosulfate sulfotransferase (PAPS reductase)/FAD synthetase